LIILLYHRVLPRRGFDPFNLIVTTGTFLKQIGIISKKYSVISLNDAAYQARSGRPRARTQVVLTFDDGYRDNYEIAFPILKRKGLPATFFLVTGYVGKKRILWDRAAIDFLNRHREVGKVEIRGKRIRHRAGEARILFIMKVLERLKAENAETIDAFMDSLPVRSGRKDVCGNNRDQCLTWEEAGRMSRGGMEIGSHGLSHRSLAMIPIDEAKGEIIASKEAVEKGTQNPCAHFAFPFGTQRDYNRSLIRCVKKAGFKTCLLNEHGYNILGKDDLCFKRIIVKEFSDPAVL